MTVVVEKKGKKVLFIRQTLLLLRLLDCQVSFSSSPCFSSSLPFFPSPSSLSRHPSCSKLTACMHASKSCSSLFFSICSRLHQVIINMLLPAAAPYPSSSSPLFTSTISAKVRYTMRNKIVSSNRKTDRYLQISSFFIFGIADLLKTPTLRS